jgi:DNA polymerase-1
MDRKLILGIDYNNIMFASYYSPEKINSKLINTNAINGFFFKLKKLKEYVNPDYIVICNDLGREKTFRRKIYPGYKANRQSTPSSIGEQFAYGLQIAQALGYPIINDDNYEADDTLGMISRYAIDNNMDMIIASSDRDYFQLVTDEINIFNMKHQELIDIEWIQNKYGLTPDQLIDLKALIGDKSDNIPGARGIGEYTGLELLQTWGSIEKIYKNLECIKPALRNRLELDKKNVDMSKFLGTIITDYSLIDINMNKIERQPQDTNQLRDVINYLELYQLHDIMKYTLLHDKLITE